MHGMLPTSPWTIRLTDRRLWKHYLPATTAAGGKNEFGPCRTNWMDQILLPRTFPAAWPLRHGVCRWVSKSNKQTSDIHYGCMRPERGKVKSAAQFFLWCFAFWEWCILAFEWGCHGLYGDGTGILMYPMTRPGRAQPTVQALQAIMLPVCFPFLGLLATLLLTVQQS